MASSKLEKWRRLHYGLYRLLDKADVFPESDEGGNTDFYGGIRGYMFLNKEDLEFSQPSAPNTAQLTKGTD